MRNQLFFVNLEIQRCTVLNSQELQCRLSAAETNFCLKWDMKNRFNGFLRYFIVRYPAPKALKCPLHAMSLLSSSANLMWCWLQWLWLRACCCCSGWHYSAVAGTSPSDAPRDQPDPARCSPLCKYRREKYLLHLFMQLWWLLCLSRCVRIKQNTSCMSCMLLSPCLLSLVVGAVVGQGHRPEHFRVRSFPVRHACCSSLHCNTHTVIKHTRTHTDDIDKGTQRWSEMSYCRNADQIFMRWPTVSLNSKSESCSWMRFPTFTCTQGQK